MTPFSAHPRRRNLSSRSSRLGVATTLLEQLESRTLFSAGASPLSPPPIVTSIGPAPLTAPLVSALRGPSNLTQSVASPTKVTLSWTNNDATATGFWLFRSTDGVNFSQIAKVASPSTVTYSDTTVLPFKTYYYKVHAYTASTTSSPSNTVTAATPLGVPSAVTLTVKSPTSLQIDWANSDASALGYVVMRSTDGVNFTQVGAINSGATKSFNDTTVASNISYTYKVRAVNGSYTSAFSATVNTTTPLAAPTQFTATVQSGSAIALSWNNADANTTGYTLLRSTDGTNFATLTTLSSAALTTYTDTGLTSGRTYYYQLKATAGVNASALTAKVSAGIYLTAPSNLVTTVNGPTNIRLNWTGNDLNATGYHILRSTNGAAFTKIATVATLTYTDATVTQGQSYTYAVQAYAGSATTAAFGGSAVVTPLNAPANAAVSQLDGWLKVTWSANAAATGYTVFRSTDGANFSQLATVASSATSYVDNTVASPTTYYYKVQAANAVITSAYSSTLSAAPALVDPTGNVTITTRYGSELVITASGSNNSVLVTQSGSTLSITTGGQVYTQPVPSTGLFIYARGGSDTITIDSSVTLRTTIAAIDNAATIISSAGANVSIWADSTDSFSGTGTFHAVASFAAGVSKALGASMANPADSGALKTATGSLWGVAPTPSDINQGGVGDCYFLASLAGFANTNVARLIESAVDMGDGTYVVQYFKQGSPTYIRISSAMPAGGWNGFKYQHPGASGSIWGMVLEKAFAYFRTGANTYASINSGWMGEAYSLFNISSTSPQPATMTDTNLFNAVTTALANRRVVTAATQSGTQLVPGHAYTIIGASRDANGVARYVVRNPWGSSGASAENSQGLATLTHSQLLQAFGWLCIAA